MKRKHGQVFVRDFCGLSDQIQNVGSLPAEAWVDGLAGVEENGDFQLRGIGAGKALKIADDNIFVNHREITGLQAGDAAMVLIGGRKGQAHFVGAGAISEFGGIARNGRSDAGAKQQK
jgi:hypothetical protein